MSGPAKLLEGPARIARGQRQGPAGQSDHRFDSSGRASACFTAAEACSTSPTSRQARANTDSPEASCMATLVAARADSTSAIASASRPCK